MKSTILGGKNIVFDDIFLSNKLFYFTSYFILRKYFKLLNKLFYLKSFPF